MLIYLHFQFIGHPDEDLGPSIDTLKELFTAFRLQASTKHAYLGALRCHS